jgi:hypothetical protein
MQKTAEKIFEFISLIPSPCQEISAPNVTEPLNCHYKVVTKQARKRPLSAAARIFCLNEFIM